MGLSAIALGWLVGLAPLANCRWSGGALGVGLLATLPAVALFFVGERIRWTPIKRLSELVHELVGSIFRGCSPAELALVSLAAGIGEELLFRGLLQAFLADRIHFAAALLLASLAFGLVHWLSTTYFILASFMGLYLGWLYWTTGNLAIPIIVHALYDAVALIYVCRPATR